MNTPAWIHPNVAAFMDRADKRARAERHNFQNANRLLAEHGLVALMDLLDTHQSFYVFRDYWGSRDMTLPAPRYHMTFHLPATLKPLLRELLLDAFPSWTRTVEVNSSAYSLKTYYGPTLCERWRVEWAQLKHPTHPREFAHNSIEIAWESPVKAGYKPSSTCTVVNATDTMTRLTITCSKPHYDED